MGTWGELISEVNRRAPSEPAVFDKVRGASLQALADLTGRPTIFYATAHLQKKGAPPEALSITDEDMQGFMETVHGLSGGALDLLLHSPGGTPEAAESMVLYLRAKFSDIRIIVPHMAMSAAAMMACAGNRIVMGKHSKLGPIDPQMVLHSADGYQLVPARAVLEQFEMAKEECASEISAVWYPIIRPYGPSLLQECREAEDYAKSAVRAWLRDNMFFGMEDAEERAARVADGLAYRSVHKTHSRPLSRAYLRELGLEIVDLESDQELQDRVLTVYHAMMITFNLTGAVKVIENHQGRRWVKQIETINLIQ